MERTTGFSRSIATNNKHIHIHPTSSPSTLTKEPTQEQKEEIEVMIAPKELQIVTDEIKNDIEKQDQRKDDLMTNLSETGCGTSKTDHTSKALEDKGDEFISMDNADQKM